jgi:hypothetical protein
VEAVLLVLCEGLEDGVWGGSLGEGEGDCAAELVGAEAGLCYGGEDAGAVDYFGLHRFLGGFEEEGDVGGGGERVASDEDADLFGPGFFD